MTEWEYKTITQPCSSGREGDLRAVDSTKTNELNRLGAEGWELVAVIPLFEEGMTGGVSFVFKRPVGDVEIYGGHAK